MSSSVNVRPVESMPDFFVLSARSGDMAADIVLTRADLSALPHLVRDAVAQSELLKRNPH